MKVSELWLREWVNPSLDRQQLAALLTMAGLEVDAVTPVAGVFDNVIVAQVIQTTPHPQANKLTLCEVNTGSGESLKIVCGAANVRAGLKVALAQIGANLPDGLTIQETKIRGELSQGMLCSAAELGLADTADGIMELSEDAPLGLDFRDFLLLNDYVFDIDLTPNRADCFSVLGIAREVAALTKLPLQSIPHEVNQPELDERLNVQLKANRACALYAGRIIRNINPQAKTPLWLSELLRRSGVRSIHPVVDVLNYVMLELGQPMHAFDLETIKGDIIVRYANSGETLTLLNDQQIALNDRVIIISDDEKPLALAGIMGGEASAVKETTQDIFLESAFFNPLTIAGVARTYGLCSDASQRFERGVDYALPVLALERATLLLRAIVGGDVGPVSLQSAPDALPQQKTVTFNPKRVKQLTGMTVLEEDMAGMLQNLGMTVDKTRPLWQVKIPTHRFDLSLESDLVEEIIRLYGYDKIVGTKMVASVKAGNVDQYETLAIRISDYFAARGYHETISYSFVDPELQQTLYPHKKTMQLLNPISSELSQMRASLWPGLLASMLYNIHRQQTAIKFFEHGVVFDLSSGTLQEQHCVAGLLTGTQGALNWSEATQKFDFYDLKGDLEGLLAVLHKKNVYFTSSEHPALHPGKSAAIVIDNQQAGWCGILHPRLADELDLQDEVILFELNLKTLFNNHSLSYQQISKFPQIRRDLSLIVNNSLSAAQIEKLVRETINPDLLKAFDVFDLYTGESIPEGKKSLAIALTLQHNQRTLVEDEINLQISAIIKKLNEEFSIILRD